MKSPWSPRAFHIVTYDVLDEGSRSNAQNWAFMPNIAFTVPIRLSSNQADILKPSRRFHSARNNDPGQRQGLKGEIQIFVFFYIFISSASSSPGGVQGVRTNPLWLPWFSFYIQARSTIPFFEAC